MANTTSTTRQEETRAVPKEATSSAMRSAAEMASSLEDKAEDVTSALGCGIRSAAETVREKLPHDGMVGSATSAVADTLESGGRYLEEKGLRGMAQDLTNVIRHNPIPALLIGIGIGYLLARARRS